MLSLDYKDAINARQYSDDVQTMAERIRALREAQGMTQTALARLVGVTPAAVSQWELGVVANVKLQTFLRLCDSLHTDPHYLIYGSDRGRAAAARAKTTPY